MSDIIEKLKSYTKMDNIAEESDLDYQKCCKIGHDALFGFNDDLDSMQEWLADVKKVEELASLTAKTKNTPLPNSANIKYPLITKAAYEFSSRTYPEIIKDGKVVKARVIGLDLDSKKQERCDRVSDYLNYQLLFEQEEWELEFDRLLNQIALIGFICKKQYYDKVREVIRSDIIAPTDLIINSCVKSLQDAPRVSHVMRLRINDLIEHVNAGLFCKEAVLKRIEELKDDNLNPLIEIIEQETFIDLDGDNYLEPYTVTIFKDSGELLRIAPRFTKDSIKTKNNKLMYINPIQMYTDYHFLVSPKGKFHSVGFGILMLHLNETINTVLNQLIDAGKLANMQGGYKDSRLKNMKGGDSLHNPGEWLDMKVTAGSNLKDGMVPLVYKEPSNVLYQLLGLLIQTGKDLSSSTEVMTGASSVDNVKTGAVQALQQAGLKVFTSIQKRVYRSMSSEFKKLYILNSMYLDEKKYFVFQDNPKVVMKEDFKTNDLNILPTADPNLSSDVQRSYRNQILLAAQSLPGTDKIKLTLEVLKNSNLGIPVEELMMSQQEMSKPDPQIIKIQADIENMAQEKKLKAEELMIRQFEAKTEFHKVESLVLLQKAQAMLYIAQAQAQQDNGKFKEYELQLDTLSTHLAAMKDAASFMADGQQHADNMELQHRQLDQEAQSNEQAPPDAGVDGAPADAPPDQQAQGA